MSTVADTHRFLYGKSLQAIDKRIWICGGQIHDWFYHDRLFGCVTLRRTLEQWALAQGMALTVTLDREGQLDFSGNPDPSAAQARFEGHRPRRKPKYGQPWSGVSAPSTAQAEGKGDTETADRAPQIAGQVQQGAGGAGQGLLNTLHRLAHLIKSPRTPSLILIEDFDELLGSLELNPQTVGVSRELIRRVHDWHRDMAHNHLLVFLTLHQEVLEQEVFPKASFSSMVLSQEIPGPSAHEVYAALERLAYRHAVRIRNARVVARHLAAQGSLRTALSHVIRTIHHGAQELTLASVLQLPPISETALVQVKKELEALTGLAELKEKINRLEKKARFLRERLMEGKELPEETLHMVFTGNPGTGKTTVARLVARLFHALGWLRRDTVIELTASAVISSHVGETGENMRRRLEEARGGVLFIDEAHQLGDKVSMAPEAINAIVPAAWNWRNEMIIILAGYAQKMPDFFNMDEGLESRFPKTNRIEFHDYSNAELGEILDHKLSQKGYQLEPAIVSRLRAILAQRKQRGAFGNARGVENLMAEILERHLEGSDKASPVLTLNALPPLIHRHPAVYARAMAELDKLYGLEAVQQRIRSILDKIEYDLQEAAAGRGGETLPLHPGNMLFIGPPGTGKTTVARRIGELFYGIGCIERANTRVANRGTLVAGYQGQTAPQVQRSVEQARDGVLFIDEAYALVQGEHDTFGQEAVDELVNQITAPENAGTVFIMAGYRDELKVLTARNPGLEGRFPQRIEFSPFNPQDCMALAGQVLEEGQYNWEDGFLEQIGELAEAALVAQGENYGSARWVKSIVNGALGRMKQRVLKEGIPVDHPHRRRVLVRDLGVKS